MPRLERVKSCYSYILHIANLIVAGETYFSWVWVVPEDADNFWLNGLHIINFGTKVFLPDKLQCMNEVTLLPLGVKIRVVAVTYLLERSCVECRDPHKPILVRAKQLAKLFETAWNFGKFAACAILLLRAGVVSGVEKSTEQAGKSGEECETGTGGVVSLHKSCPKCGHRFTCCFSDDDNIIFILYFERISMKNRLTSSLPNPLSRDAW